MEPSEFGIDSPALTCRDARASFPTVSLDAEDQDSDLGPMRHALALAHEAMTMGEVPVGAVVVRDGRVVSQAFNLREALHDPTAHAERLALTLAARVLGTWRLDDCDLYVTLEPCPMCAGAIVLSRIHRLVFGASDLKAGACGSLYRIVTDRRLNHRTKIRAGVLREECGEMLSRFFRERRWAGA
jgi:tRNA(adenine34) deaminase